MTKPGAWTLAAVVVAVVSAVACSTASTDGTPLQGSGDDASAMGTGDDAGGGGCVGKLPPPQDPSKLPSCCTEGAAHCVAGSDVPSTFQAALASCSGGFCVPDKFISDPTYVPPSCKAFNGTDGVCLSLCVPQVDMYKNILQQGSCAATELCAPCVNPLTNMSSHACDIGHQMACGDAGSNPPPTDGGGTPGCPYTGPPIVDPKSLPSCDPNGGAHCLDKTLVPPAMQSKLAACGASGLCVPDVFIASGGNYIPPTCDSLGGDEGRCLDEVIPQVAAQLSQLPVSTCKSYERCVPCYDPRDLSDTGACKLSCDPGPARGKPTCPHMGPPYTDPSMLPSCSDMNTAHCLDKSQVSPQLQMQLAACNNGGVCVPDVFSENAGRYVPPTCDSLGGDEGRCLDYSIPAIAAQKDKLPQGTCKANERCAPCYDPRDLSDTGACHLSCDAGPARPKPTCPHNGPPYLDPTQFPSCDASNSDHCLDASYVSAQLQSQLASCGNGGFCVPDVFSENAGRYVPPTCTSLLGAEGRCLNVAIPQVAAQQSQLPQDVCQSYERCVPCYSPVDGSDTGACKLSCDPGPQQPPVLFQDCCGADGKCVPTSVIPQSEQSNLSADVCSDPSTLCVPTEMLVPNFSPPACTGSSIVYLGSYTGVCLSDCLSFSFFQSLGISQGDCDNTHECVPCFTPVGAPSGAPGCQ
jgi:hypothetical protein